MEEPQLGEIYEHFKGRDKQYQIICVTRNCGDPLVKRVIYKQLYEGDKFPSGTLWDRRLEVFCGDKVFDEDKDYGERVFKKGDIVKRFVKVRGGN
ncbi:MAG: DUF1653 domain-containing protein [archaeon]